MTATLPVAHPLHDMVALALPAFSVSVAHATTTRTEPRLEALYQQHYAFVRRSLRYLGVPDQAVADAIQDVFVVALRRLPDFEGRSTVQTWLFGIAVRVAHGERRKVERGRRLADGVRLLLGTPPSDDRLEHRQAARVLARLLDALADEQRAVFVLAEIEGMSAPEIGTALGINVNTVYSRLRLARRKFERALARLRARERAST